MADMMERSEADMAFSDFFGAIAQGRSGRAIQMAADAWEHGGDGVRLRAVELAGVARVENPSDESEVGALLGVMMNAGANWVKIVVRTIPGQCWRCQSMIIKVLEGKAALLVDDELPGYCSEAFKSKPAALARSPAVFAEMLLAGRLSDDAILTTVGAAAMQVAKERGSNLRRGESKFSEVVARTAPSWLASYWAAYWRQGALGRMHPPLVLELSVGTSVDPFESLVAETSTPGLEELLSRFAMKAIAEQSVGGFHAIAALGRWLGPRPSLAHDLGASARQETACEGGRLARPDSHACIYMTLSGEPQGWLEGVNESGRALAAVAGEKRLAVNASKIEPAAKHAFVAASAFAAMADGLADGGAEPPEFALRAAEPKESSRGGRPISLAKASILRGIAEPEGKRFGLLPLALAFAGGADISAKSLEWMVRGGTAADEAAIANLAKEIAAHGHGQVVTVVESIVMALSSRCLDEAKGSARPPFRL